MKSTSLTVSLFLSAIIFTLSSAVLAQGNNKCLKSRLAGSWYSADKTELEDEISTYIKDAGEQKVSGNILGLILPHAGYRYSGRIAAYGIKQIMNKSYKRVIILGPTHRVPMRNSISVSDFSHYSTPLGRVPLDTEAIAKLRKYDFVKNIEFSHTSEHSVQIMLPFLQYALKDFSIIPVVVGQLDSDSTKKIADALLEITDDKTLVIASSDFTHYGARFNYTPFKDNIPENIKKLDMGAWNLIEKLNLINFTKYMDQTAATICGKNTIGILMLMLPHNSKPQLLKYGTSGEMTGEYSNSVSYLAAAFTGKWEKLKEAVISDDDKKKLLALARKTLTYYLRNNTPPAIEELDIELTPGMQKIMGAFVTLHKNGRLRGCIGEIKPRRALYQAVMDHAINSAVRDWRFRPVTPSELKEIDFEISALTPPEKVASWKDIEIGKHGMTLSKDGRSAVFLPQVAPEQNWDIAETLTQLSQKAGLPADAWKQGAQFTVFEAVVFNEDQFKNK